MPALSVCMIVRNEEEQLPGCLASLSDLNAQIIVVDTGSNDATVKIAEAAGAEIHYFDWIDDFSAARNESLKYATGAWRLWIDADERIDTATAGILVKLPKRALKPTVYQVHLRSHKIGDDYVSMSMSHRLISHHHQIHFSGRIHEQVYPSVVNSGGVELKSGLILDHYGYALDEKEMTKKLQRNRPMLEAMLEEGGNRTYALYTLAQNYSLAKDYGQALQMYERALNEGGFRGLSLVPLYNNLANTSLQLGRKDEAEAYIHKSLAIAPEQTSGNFVLYRLHQAAGNVEGQIEALEGVLHMSQKSAVGQIGTIAQDVVIAPEHVQFTLAQLYLSKGDFAAAEGAVKEPLSNDPDNMELVGLLLQALAGQNRWDAVMDIIEGGDLEVKSRFKELQGIALIKLQKFDRASQFYEAWLEEDPSNTAVTRRLAGIFAKVGRVDEAERLLISLQGRSEPEN